LNLGHPWIRTLSLALLLALVPTAALASPEEVAEWAEEVHARYCGDAASDRATRAAEALARISPLLARVSRSYDESGALFLLYWRGLLYECVEQEERARADLEDFVQQAAEQPVYADLVRQARRRLGHSLGGATAPRSAPPPAPVLGASLVGASAALGGAAGGLAAQAQRAQGLWDAGMRPFAETEQVGLDAVRMDTSARVLVAGCVVSSLVGAAVLIGSGVRRGKPSPTALVLPLPEGGLALSVGGTW
jgi:hypothetical protein